MEREKSSFRVKLLMFSCKWTGTFVLDWKEHLFHFDSKNSKSFFCYRVKKGCFTRTLKKQSLSVMCLLTELKGAWLKTKVNQLIFFAFQITGVCALPWFLLESLRSNSTPERIVKTVWKWTKLQAHEPFFWFSLTSCLCTWTQVRFHLLFLLGLTKDSGSACKQTLLLLN